MAENYVVNYDINVRSQAAIQALNSFQQATNKLQQAGKQLTAFQKKIEAVTNKLNQMSRKAPVLDIATSKVNKKLDATIAKLEKIHRLAKKTAALNVTTGPAPAGSRNTSGSNNTGRTSRRPSTVYAGGFSRASINRGLPKDLSYKLLGPTPLDVGGVMGVDFLKGMGIAYGISGAGALIGNVIRDATEYDNIMQTAKNILKTHDKNGNFNGRFAQMAQTVRDVGVETKFTAPQVADAAKFLAMAGFDINAINQSIRPISDIALVGDTDLGETADVVTNIMTGYGISPDRIRKAADIMTMTFTKSNTTLMEIAEAYKYSASLLSAGGIDFEEATAGLGILGDAGIKGSQAGTTMRTIMANIINPTKKQLANWERIGVARTDANGRVRPLMEIFKDLSEAGLYVDDFYKLFHKTAAQGAVSLANNVDKWNEIIRENFLSGGVAKKLAEEKKNTIAGLWAQLTSQFTEDGMKAFEAVQQPVKDFLNEMLGWLKQDATTAMFKELATDMMEFVHMLKDVTKTFLGWYKALKPFIKLWLEFQLRMMPVLAGLKIFKASLLGVSGIIKFAGQIAFLIGKVNLLTKSLRAAWIAARGMGVLNMIAGSIAQPARTFLQGNFYNGLTGKNVSPAVWQRYFAMQSRNSGGAHVTPLGGIASFGKMAKFGAGGLVGGLAGSAIGEAVGGSTGSMWGGILGGAAGLGLMALGGPVGWIGAGVLALGGLCAALYNSSVESAKAQKAFEDFASSVRMIDGVLSGDGLTTTEKYLEIVYNKQLAINTVVARRIELLKEELGLKDPANITANDATLDGKVLQEGATNLIGTDHWYGSGNMAKNAAYLANQFNRRVVQSASGDWYWYDITGHSQKIANPDGGNDSQDALAALSSLYAEGVSGSMSKQVKDEFAGRLAYILSHNGTLQDIQGVKNDWWQRFANYKYDKDTHPEHFAYGVEDIKSWSSDKIAKSYTFSQGLYDSMSAIYGSNAKVWRVAEDYFNAVGNGQINESLVVEYLSLMDNSLGALLNEYSYKTIDKWASELGYENGTFIGKEGHPALTVAQTTRAALDELLTVIPRLDTEAQNAVSNLFTFATQLRGLADNYIWQHTGGKVNQVIKASEGTTTKLNGHDWKYEIGDNGVGAWWPYKNGNRVAPMTSMTNEAMQAALSQQQKTSNNPQTPIVPTNNNPSSDYKSHYNNNSAAPKQVIVKIENLMNVESVDLSNPDNAAVIADLKGQLTQALVDVVHDFDETYHG